MHNEPTTDADLLRAFQRGDNHAFETLVYRYQDRVFRLAGLWLTDASLAEDAAQEVFLRGYRGLRRFQFRAEPFTWMYRTTQNVCREFNRRRHTQSLPDELLDSAPGPDVVVPDAHTIARVRALVSGLPQRQREVVWLRIFEQCSVEETAHAMGCRQGTVKALLHKAVARLRLSIDPEEL